MQRNMPYVTDAHVGFLAGQSKHTWRADDTVRCDGCQTTIYHTLFSLWRFILANNLTASSCGRTSIVAATEAAHPGATEPPPHPPHLWHRTKK